MGTYEELKAAIQQVIRTNGNNEITGALLQQTLLSIVNSVGANATFAGMATPNTNPGTADQNVYYLATEAGTYVNFGGIQIAEGEAVILSNKTGNWTKTTSGFATQQQLTELESKVSFMRGNASDNFDISYLDNGTELIIYSEYSPTQIYIDSDGGRELIGTINELSFGGLFHYTKKEGDLSILIWQGGEVHNHWVTDAPTLIKILKEIKSNNLNKVDVSLSLNLADSSKVEIGKYINNNTGALASSSVYNVTDYIRCKPNTTYYQAKEMVGGFTRCLSYDSNHKAIAESYNSSAGESYTTSSNAAYMRLTYFADDQELLQVSESKVMNYVPYSPIGGYLTDIMNNISINSIEIDSLKYNKQYTIGGYLSRDNEVVSNDDYAYSNYIPVTPATILKVISSVRVGNIYLMILLYDKELQQIDRWTIQDDGEKEFTTIANTCYIRFSFRIADAHFVKVEENGLVIWSAEQLQRDKIASELNEKVKKDVGVNLIDVSKSSENVYIYNENGVLGDSENYNVTDYIRCKPNTTYYQAKDSNSGFTRCLCYDGEKNAIAESFINLDNGYSFTTAPNAVYMRLTYFKSNTRVQLTEGKSVNYQPYSPIGGYLIDLYDKFNYNDFFSIFDNWGFIGDSLTSGYLSVPNVNGVSPLSDVKGGFGRNIYRLSWGQILCKKYGVRGTNFSLGGMTARNWVLNYPIGKYNGYSNETKEYQVDFSSDIKTSYTICLGTNDVANETINPLGSISDIDLTNKDNNVDSFYGNYAKIIQYCRELCPSCKIFLITPMLEWSTAAETRGYNNAAREICQLFDNCYLIDLAKSNIFVPEQYNYEAHPTSIGYAFVADLIKRAINDIVTNNMEDFIFQGAIESLKNGYDDGSY